MRATFSAVLAAVVIVSPLAAQQQPSTEKKKLTLKATLEMPTLGGYQLSPDGKQVLFTRTERDPKDWS
ncbi:MAG: hypothetical protein ACREMQ_15265, partial [Longimicrobiales bacterium]